MDKLNYCLDCRRVFSTADECSYCNSGNVKELVKDSPVNVIGSKLKGRVLKANQGMAQVLFVDESKNKTIKEFDSSKIRKVL